MKGTDESAIASLEGSLSGLLRTFLSCDKRKSVLTFTEAMQAVWPYGPYLVFVHLPKEGA